jgi:hypothetical protein
MEWKKTTERNTTQEEGMEWMFETTLCICILTACVCGGLTEAMLDG